MSNMKDTPLPRHAELDSASPDLKAMEDALDAAIAKETPESIKTFVAQSYAEYDAQPFYFTAEGWQCDTNTICKLPCAALK